MNSITFEGIHRTTPNTVQRWVQLDVATNERVAKFIRECSTNKRVRVTIEVIETEDEEVDEFPMPWCDECRSYHVVPKTKGHHELLKCRKHWKETTP